MTPISESTKIKSARLAIIIVFLALIRTLIEILRLQYYGDSSIDPESIRYLLIAALVCAVSSFIMVMLSFYQKHVFVIGMGIAAIAAIVFIKFYYGI